MSSTIQVGKRTFTTDAICEQLSSSDLLPQLIREMVIDEILEDWDIEIDRKIPYSREEFGQGCDRLGKLADYQGLNQLQLYKIVDRHLRLQKFKESRWANKIYSYFLHRKDTLDRVKFSLIQVEDRGLAEELFFRVQRGEQSFADLAFKYSQGDAAKDGGKIDTIDIDRTHPDLAPYLRGLKECQTSPIFSLDNLFTFVRLDSWIYAELNDSLRQILIDELFNKWVQQQISIRLGLFKVDDTVNLTELNEEPDPTLIEPEPLEITDEQTESIELFEPTSSFFFPKPISELDDKLADREYPSSLFISQGRPTQIINNSSRSWAGQKFISFLLFFFMFLGLEAITAHIFNHLVIPRVNIGNLQLR